MSTLVTCMGECLIDFVPINTTDQYGNQAGSGRDKREDQGEVSLKGTTDISFRMHPGGSIFNVAVGLARLREHVAFAGKIAEDYFGQHLLQTLKSEGVDTRFVSMSQAQTTLAFVTVVDGQPAFTFYGEGTADSLLTVEDIPETLYQETGILHVGSVSLLRGTTPATVVSTVERLKGKALLSIDPNIRANLIHDEPQYRALLQHVIALSDIVKLSDVDLAWLLPGASVEEALLHLCELGPALAIVTQGEKGVMAQSGSIPAIQVPTIPVSLVDTVGAGDSFCAGVLAWMADNAITSHQEVLALAESELRAALTFASVVAGLNCAKAGANPPSRFEVEQFMAQLA